MVVLLVRCIVLLWLCMWCRVRIGKNIFCCYSGCVSGILVRVGLMK